MLNTVWHCHANKQGSKDLGKNKTKQTNTTTPKQQPYTLWKKYSWLWQLNTDNTLPILHIFQIKLVPPTFLFLYSPSQSCTFKWAWLIVGMFHPLRFTCPLLKLRLEKTSGNIRSHLLWKQGLKLGYARQGQKPWIFPARVTPPPPWETYSNVDLFSWLEFFPYTQMEFPLSNPGLVPHALCTPVFASSIQTIVGALEDCD